jgi:hypothetical protein
MNKKTLKMLVLLSVITSNANLMAIIDQIATPIPIDRGYAFSHYPFARLDYQDDKCWYLDVWGAGVHKHANFAFKNKNTTGKESLSGIFFGADTFTISQAFAPGTVVPDNPLLFISQFTPKFDYTEDDAFFGVNVEFPFGCECNWHAGFRARVPFRETRVGLDSCCELVDITNVSQLALTQNEIDPDPACTPGEINNAFAYRMDLVALLHKNANQTSPVDLLLQCNDATATPPQITLSEIDLGKGPDGSGANDHPVHVISRTDGTAPTFPSVPFFGLRSDSTTNPCPLDLPEIFVTNVGSVNGGANAPLPFLSANGSGLPNNQRARFNAATNYTPLCTSPFLSTLWLVPTLDGNVADDSFDLSTDSNDIRLDINNALLAVGSNNSLTFLNALGINFDTVRNNGIGNFDTELYVRYDDCNCCWGPWFAEGIFGVRWPTDTQVTTTSNLLAVPTGNFRHYEIKLGGYLGWQPCDWLAIKADAWYYWALRHKQIIPAPLAGATIFGVGPGVEARTSWQYFIGDIDFTFLVPCIDPYTGFNVGYQAWVKRKTHVSFDVSSVVDFFGVTQPLDSTLLRSRTKRIAHTVKAEIFRQTCDWQIYAGWNHAFAGKNALNDSDWYLGLEVYF